MSIKLALTPAEQEKQLQAAAKRKNVPPAALVSAAVRDLLAQASTDFKRVADRIVDKNRELYRRLA
jgi:hypothetical protein